MPRNGDIRNWFSSQASQASQQAAPRLSVPSSPSPALSTPAAKSVNRTPETARHATTQSRDPSIASPSPLRPPPAPFQDVPSSPPSVADSEERHPVSRDAVIAASDDDQGFDSDDSSLPDIFDLGGPSRNGLGRPPPPSTTAKRPLINPCVTPRAKRTVTAQEFLSSPLTIQSKKHKYNMDAMLAFNEKDEETRASAARFSAFLEQEARDLAAAQQAEDEPRADDDIVANDWHDDDDDERKASRRLKERILKSATAAVDDDAKDDHEAGAGGTGKMRIVRALERADVGTRIKTYYFFEETEADSEASVVGRPFPTRAAAGEWVILKDGQDRARHFQSGFPFDIQRQFESLPDEIFLWILDEFCFETRRDVQTEYVKLLRICHKQVHRLMTPAVLQRLFRNLGATKDVENLSSPVSLREEVSQPYSKRSWSCVESFLDLVGSASNHLHPATRTAAMQILLRLGMDNVAMENFGLTQEWRWAVDLVARSIPNSEWNSFCQEVCTCLYQSTERAILRYRAIVLLGPVQNPGVSSDLQRRTLDLKRRLACVFFFDDIKRADKIPEDTINIRAVIDRLEEDEFQINVETDYRELHALMMMMNVALGDASRERVALTTGLIRNFDAEVDELADGMKTMITRVAPLSKGIHTTRIEAKSAMELIRERLLYHVRIRSPPKKQSLFDSVESEDSSAPKQKSLSCFFSKRPEPKIQDEGLVAE